MARRAYNALKVPFALDANGRVVRATVDVLDGAALTCLGCGDALIVRGGAGMSVRRHFAHYGDRTCSMETVLHVAAKLTVARVLQEAIEGGPVIQVLRWCPRRTHMSWSTSAWTRADDRVDLEHRLESGRVADVALVRGGSAVAVVEIHVTNKVTEEKAEDLVGVRWVELEAEDVLRDPLQWRPLWARDVPHTCPECIERDRAYREAGLPPWVDELRVPEPPRDHACEVVLEGRVVCFKTRYRPPGWNDRNDQEVRCAPLARLSRHVERWEWLGQQPRRANSAKEMAARFPALPSHVAFYWEAAAAVREFGGRWVWSSEEELAPLPEPEEERWPRIRRIAKKTGQPVPPGRASPYWVAPWECWGEDCGAEMLIYSWKGHVWMSDVEPPAPRPPTIFLCRPRRRSGAFYANVCPRCNRIQGDERVYVPAGPLPGHLAGRAPGW